MRTDDFLSLHRGLFVRGGRRLCWHRYRLDEVHGVWRYQQCARCGRRRVSRIVANLMGPLDWSWLETGEWALPPKIPPKPAGLPPPSRRAP